MRVFAINTLSSRAKGGPTRHAGEALRETNQRLWESAGAIGHEQRAAHHGCRRECHLNNHKGE